MFDMLMEDIWEELRDLPLYGETVIRGHCVRRISTVHFWIVGVDSPLTKSAAADYLARHRYEEDYE